jgi:GNAT superfamily N-acetyltransferase
MTKRHLPPATKFVGPTHNLAPAATSMIQKKSSPLQAKPAPGISRSTFLPPASPQPARPRLQPKGLTVQCAAAVAVTTHSKLLYDIQGVPGAAYPIRLRSEVKPNKRGQDIHIYATDWDHADWSAHLHGEIDGTMAWIETLESGRFPAGRGVGYRLVQEFVTKAQTLGATHCRLGTPVNTASLTAAHIPQNAGEWGAIVLYTRLGFDVTTAEMASQSIIPIGTLRARAAQISAEKGWH